MSAKWRLFCLGLNVLKQLKLNQVQCIQLPQTRKHTAYVCRPLQRRHNQSKGVSNHQRPDCLLNGLFRRRSKNTKAHHHWPLWGEFTGDLWISITRASNAENISIWWRHHVIEISHPKPNSDASPVPIWYIVEGIPVTQRLTGPGLTRHLQRGMIRN